MPKFLESIANQIPSFVGIKMTSTNLVEAAEAVHVEGGKFIIFLGMDPVRAPNYGFLNNY